MKDLLAKIEKFVQENSISEPTEGVFEGSRFEYYEIDGFRYLRTTSILSNYCTQRTRDYLRDTPKRKSEHVFKFASNVGSQVHYKIEDPERKLDLKWIRKPREPKWEKVLKESIDQIEDPKHKANALEACEKLFVDIPTKEEQIELAQMQVRFAYKAFEKFMESKDIHIIYQELKVFCPLLQIAGTIDAIAKINNKIYLIDWKTSSSIKTEHRWQLSVYKYMFEAIFGIEVGVMAVKLGKMDMEFTEVNYNHFDMSFRAYLGVYQAFIDDNFKGFAKLNDYTPKVLATFQQYVGTVQHREFLGEEGALW